MRAPIRYAKSGDIRVAYQVTGEGPIDLVWAPGTFSHLALDWEWPPRVRLIEGLGSFARLIRFDKRGTGMSDRAVGIPTLEERTDDIRAVMDAAGSERAAIFGGSEGGSMAVMFAAMYPQRTRALVLYGCQARWTQTDGYPWGQTRAEYRAMIESLRDDWPSMDYLTGGGAGVGRNADAAFLEWLMGYAQAGASPSAIVALEEMNVDIDVRDILPTLSVPTLVVNRTGDPVAYVDAARDMAEHIPGARFVEFPGDTHAVTDIADIFVAELRGFLTGVPAMAPSSRILATILVVDIVGSTEIAARRGDAAWRDLLSRYDVTVEQQVKAFDGRTVDRAGDGLLAAFDGPTRAIRCAQSIARAAGLLGLAVRAGVHTGEVEVEGSLVRGIAVHIAARIGALAGADEVLVSSTVRDLTAGSGLDYDDRGRHVLKGVPEARQVFAVA